MRHHADSMRYDRMYTLLWIYAAALALFGLFLGPLEQILPGLATIVLTEDALITDYVLIAGPDTAACCSPAGGPPATICACSAPARF